MTAAKDNLHIVSGAKAPCDDNTETQDHFVMTAIWTDAYIAVP